MRTEYEGLSPEELAERLALAEDVCRMVGWTPPAASERGKALVELWKMWFRHAGDQAVDPERYPHLGDAAITELASQGWPSAPTPALKRSRRTRQQDGRLAVMRPSGRDDA